jgi:type II secretory ATPase GspE/PulE/Tfp pilus assembly ATPase PilB-like protein
MIMDNVSAEEIRDVAVEEGMLTMLQDGYLKALEGITTLEEVLRVSKE